MKKQLVSLAVCTALLCAACAPASAAQPVGPLSRPARLAAAPALARAATLDMSAGEETFSISPYKDGNRLTTITVKDADGLPKLPAGVAAQVTVTREIPVSADSKDENAPTFVTVFSGDEQAFAAFVPRQNFDYDYTVTTQDGTDYRFVVSVELAPRVRLSAEGAKLGETLVIYADYTRNWKVSGTTTLSRQPKFYLGGNTEDTMALLPVSYNVAPGEYDLTVTFTHSQTGEVVSFPYQIKADKRDFVVQNLTVDNSTASSTINNDFANREWNEKIEPLKYITDSTKYWDGKFLMPVQGRTTTEFGTIRYTNGSKTSSRHGAMDIAASTGTPVPAANAGRVIFAQYIQMSGNVVVIEHGLGLKTWYFHMSEIDVKENQMVKKGDIIGKVGATGFVTGPHLHFGMSVNDVYINPLTAVNNGIG